MIFTNKKIGKSAYASLTQDGQLIISGTGRIQSSADNAPSTIELFFFTYAWDKNKDAIKSVVVEDGITNVPACAFMNYPNLEKVVLPASVKTIEQYAFQDCRMLKEVIMQNGVEVIEKNAFCGCQRLASALLPNTVKDIEESAFRKCGALQSVVIPASVQTIGMRAFVSAQEILVQGKASEAEFVSICDNWQCLANVLYEK